MTTETLHATNEAQIRDLFERWTKTIRAKDLEGLKAYYAPDLLAFDAVPPLRIPVETFCEHWQQCFAYCDGPLEFDVRELNITASGDVAFAHCLTGLRAKGKDGEMQDFWARTTLCLRKIDGRWLIVHQHDSVPFDCETNKALVNLKP